MSALCWNGHYFLIGAARMTAGSRGPQLRGPELDVQAHPAPCQCELLCEIFAARLARQNALRPWLPNAAIADD